MISRACAHRDYFEIIDPIELVVPAAWLALRTFDTERRRRHIAASLISDAVFAAFRAPLRRRSSSEEVRSPERFEEDADALAPRSAMEELAEVVRDARGAGVPTGDIELLRRLAQVESPSTVADERKVTSRTIRNHRDRAVERVRAGPRHRRLNVRDVSPMASDTIGTGYWVKLGWRFSRKAVNPSWASAIIAALAMASMATS